MGILYCGISNFFLGTSSTHLILYTRKKNKKNLKIKKAYARCFAHRL
jgi:hypothetical protein